MSGYWMLLERWNAKVNLTALPLPGAPSPSVDRLIIEPLLAVRLMPRAPMTWFDLGSGGGSPAIPIKIAIPEARLWMVESKSRKVAFLREVVRTLGLRSVDVLHDRVENVAVRQPGVAECITVRALRLDQNLLKAARQLLSSSGRLVVFENSDSAPQTSGFDTVAEVSWPEIATRIRAIVPRGTIN